MSNIKTLSGSIVYQNRWMTVREDKIERPSGAKGIYSVIEKPDFSIVIPVIKDTLVMVEQYRYPLQKRSLEFPQGACEDQPNIDPAELARKELEEETGLIATSLTHVGKQALAVGFCTQFYNIFVATEFEQGDINLDPEEEGLIKREVKISEFESLLEKGEIVDATSTTAYCLAKFKGLI